MHVQSEQAMTGALLSDDWVMTKHLCRPLLCNSRAALYIQAHDAWCNVI